MDPTSTAAERYPSIAMSAFERFGDRSKAFHSFTRPLQRFWEENWATEVSECLKQALRWWHEEAKREYCG